MNAPGSNAESSAPATRAAIREVWLLALRVGAALFVLALVMEPTVWRGLARSPTLRSVDVEVMRQVPQDARLREIAGFSFQDIPMPRGDDAIRMGDRLLAGADFMQGFSGAPYATLLAILEAVDFELVLPSVHDVVITPYALTTGKPSAGKFNVAM